MQRYMALNESNNAFDIAKQLRSLNSNGAPTNGRMARHTKAATKTW